MLKCEDQTAVQAVLTVSQSMVDCLVEVLLTLDENSGKNYDEDILTYMYVDLSSPF